MPGSYEDEARKKEKESWRKEWDLHRDNPKNKNKGNEKNKGIDLAKGADESLWEKGHRVQLKRLTRKIVLGPHELLLFSIMPQNKFATEPQTEVIDQPYFENAERVNGQLAMLGFVAALGSYITTGQIIPGIF